MNLPIVASPASHHALALRREAALSPVAVSASRPKFLPTHWPLPEVRVRRPALLAGPIDGPARNRWPGLALKILAVALCYALVRDVDAAEPLSLRYGEPQVLSALGEPVDIRIPITSKDVNPDARFILGTQDTPAGLPTLRHANIRLERDARGWALRIQSNRRSADPAMNVVVQEVVGGGVVSRTLPVLFDPAPAQSPVVMQAAAEIEVEAAPVIAARDSWWTAAANTRAFNPPASRNESRESVVRSQAPAMDPARAQPASSARIDSKFASTQTRAPQQPRTTLARTAPELTAQHPRTRTQASRVQAGLPGLRLATAIDFSARPQVISANVRSAGSTPSATDRETLRWLQRSLLGGDERVAVQALSRKVMQLNEQLASLELQVAASAARIKPVADVSSKTAATQPESCNRISAAPKAASANSCNPPLKISALMSEPGKQGNGNPWGLPLLAGLMLGAGYWSGRKSHD